MDTSFKYEFDEFGITASDSGECAEDRCDHCGDVIIEGGHKQSRASAVVTQFVKQTSKGEVRATRSEVMDTLSEVKFQEFADRIVAHFRRLTNRELAKLYGCKLV